MSLRHGITATEEVRMKKFIEEGKSWPAILAELEDVDAAYVLEHLYTPMKAAFDTAQKAAKEAKPEKTAPAGTAKL
jgi:hypothetical protein